MKHWITKVSSEDWYILTRGKKSSYISVTGKQYLFLWRHSEIQRQGDSGWIFMSYSVKLVSPMVHLRCSCQDFKLLQLTVQTGDLFPSQVAVLWIKSRML